MTTSSADTCTESFITPDCTIDAVIARSPVALAVLNGFGVDTCCGGNSSLADATAHARVDASVLIAALNAAERDAAHLPAPAAAKPTACGCGCK